MLVDPICIQSSATRKPCYYKGVGEASWNDAQNKCKEDNGYLATIRNSYENYAIFRILGHEGNIVFKNIVQILISANQTFFHFHQT